MPELILYPDFLHCFEGSKHYDCKLRVKNDLHFVGNLKMETYDY